MYSPRPKRPLKGQPTGPRRWICDCGFRIAEWKKVACRLKQSAIRNPHSAIGLAFRELEALARALLAVLLALLGARVARHQARVLERGAEVCVELHERARDAVAHRARLARGAAARDVDDDVELARGVGEGQGLAYDHAQRLIGEVHVEVLAVDADFARAGPKVDARGRSLAPPGSVILNVCHSFLFLKLKTSVYAFCARARGLSASGS